MTNFEIQEQIEEEFKKIVEFYKKNYDKDAEIIDYENSDFDLWENDESRITYQSDQLMSETNSSKISDPIEMQLSYTSSYHFQGDPNRYLILDIIIRTDYVQWMINLALDKKEEITEKEAKKRGRKVFYKDIKKLIKELNKFIEFVQPLKINNKKLYRIDITDWDNNFFEIIGF